MSAALSQLVPPMTSSTAFARMRASIGGTVTLICPLLPRMAGRLAGSSRIRSMTPGSESRTSFCSGPSSMSCIAAIRAGTAACCNSFCVGVCVDSSEAGVLAAVCVMSGLLGTIGQSSDGCALLTTYWPGAIS